MLTWSRLVLLLRAAGVVLIAIGVVAPLGLILTFGSAELFWRADRLASLRAGWVASDAMRWVWIMLNESSSLLAVGAGVYLLVRRADRLVAPWRRSGP